VSQVRGTNEFSTSVVQEVLKVCFPDWAIEPALLAEFLRDAASRDADTHPSGSSDADDDDTEFRRQEYLALRQDADDGRPKRNLLVKSRPIAHYGPIVRESFARISLVHKLRETRVFCGFSRLFPEDGLTRDERRRLIAERPPIWLPAAEVRGEGIYLELKETAVQDWLARVPEVMPHLQRMNSSLAKILARRHQPSRVVSPRFVLLHTLAHSLINQLVYECGYGSASLRERIYSDDGSRPMAGLLLYTAAGDSEGTMGGLVSMGEPGRLEGVIARAIDKARWCSADPVCIDSPGQGPDSCNLAACHACALLPETSCEQQNRLLDRAVLIGTLETPDLGFFLPSTGC
jgi:hypothetical protein